MQFQYSLFFCFVLFFFLNTILFSSPKLGEEEIRNSVKIDFLNRNAKRATGKIKQENRRIGYKLYELISAPNSMGSEEVSGFRIQRFQNIENKFGADVLSVHKSVKYGHIHSLERVLSAYLEKAFLYSEYEAEVLSRYILYYNAIHRKDIEYIQKKYSKDVIRNIEEENIGISKTYKNWAGRTSLVIPIEGFPGTKVKRRIVLDEIEKEVGDLIEKSREGKEDKEELERLIQKQKEKDEWLSKQKKKANEDDLTITDPSHKNSNLQDKETSKTLDDKEEIILKKAGPKKKEEKDKKEPSVIELELENKQLEKEKKRIENEKDSLKQNIKNKKNENDAFLDKNKELEEDTQRKTSENRDLKENIHRIKKENLSLKQVLDEKESKYYEKGKYTDNVIDGKIYFMKIIKYVPEIERYNNEIYLIDPLKDDVVIKSDYNNICSKSFKKFGKNLIMIGYTDGQFRLVLLNRYNLRLQSSSEAKLYLHSPVEISEKSMQVYAFEDEGGRFFIAKYDKNLKLLHRSKVEVQPDSEITFYGEKIYLSSRGEEGKEPEILIFKKSDLTLLKKIKP